MIDFEKINNLIMDEVKSFKNKEVSMYEYFYAYCFLLKSVANSFPVKEKRNELINHLHNYMLSENMELSDFIKDMEDKFFTIQNFGYLPKDQIMP